MLECINLSKNIQYLCGKVELITEPQTQIQVLEKAEGMGYAGYIFDFYDFMSDAVWHHVGIVGP